MALCRWGKSLGRGLSDAYAQLESLPERWVASGRQNGWAPSTRLLGVCEPVGRGIGKYLAEEFLCLKFCQGEIV